MPATISTLRKLDLTDIGETLPPLHPGELLREEFMRPLGLSAIAVARALELPRSRIERIVKEDIGISTDTALRLGRLFRMTPDFWLGLRVDFERETLLREIGPALERIEPVPEREPAAA